MELAWDYMFSQIKSHGAETGLVFSPSICYYHETYNAAVGLMAFANCVYTADLDRDMVLTDVNPLVNGLTVAEFLDKLVLWFAWSQHPQGGWTYSPCDNKFVEADNSHTGYVVIALRYADLAGAVIPATLKTNLSAFIDLIQDDITGESYYRPTWKWPNALKQGNLLVEMSFVGDAVGDARVVAAINFLASIWDEPCDDISGKGWKDPQAMYCLMKGFESFGIETITVGMDERDWFTEFADYLMSTQNADGSWPWSNWADQIVSTCWALFVLEKVAPPPPVIYVDFDIHPMSWPNPLNLKSNGVTPAAILGTDEFDVMQIDVSTLMLEGVAPVEWAYEDVTGPATSDGVCNDMYMEPDGIMDLTLKFNTQELVAAIAPVAPGDERVLIITGKNLNETLIEGDDCIKVVGNLKSAFIGGETTFNDELLQNWPNPFCNSTHITYRIAKDSRVSLKVYNLVGQEIYSLVNASQKAGEYLVEWNGGELRSGTYLYRLTTDNFTKTKTMIVKR